MIDQKAVDAVVPPSEQVLALIVRTEQHKKVIWTAGRVLKEAAFWGHVSGLEYQERKLVRKRVKMSLDALAAQDILRRRVELLNDRALAPATR